MRNALLICADVSRSEAIINALESEHDIWHVMRQRDAMAWLAKHHPETVVLDLDLLGQDVNLVLDAIRMSEIDGHALVVGLSKTPELLPPPLTARFDLVITQKYS